MLFVYIIALVTSIGYYTTVYLRYKLLIWLGYRFLSGLAHHVDSKRLLADTLLRVALTLVILYPLGWAFDWYTSHIVIENVSKTEDKMLWFGLLPILILSYMAFKVVKREFCTILGFNEKDWRWSKPDLSIFAISPENMPEKAPRRPDYGEKKKSGFSIFDLMHSDNSWSDEGWDSYQKDNYDRIYK